MCLVGPLKFITQTILFKFLKIISLLFILLSFFLFLFSFSRTSSYRSIANPQCNRAIGMVEPHWQRWPVIDWEEEEERRKREKNKRKEKRKKNMCWLDFRVVIGNKKVTFIYFSILFQIYSRKQIYS